MLREARNNTGLSREEAAHRLYIGTRTLADYELGKTIAPPDVVMKMAEGTPSGRRELGPKPGGGTRSPTTRGGNISKSGRRTRWGAGSLSSRLRAGTLALCRGGDKSVDLWSAGERSAFCGPDNAEPADRNFRTGCAGA